MRQRESVVLHAVLVAGRSDFFSRLGQAQHLLGERRRVAAPVRNHNGAVIAALGVAAPVQRMNKKLMQTCVPSVIETADAVSTRLGYLPSRSLADF